MSKNCEAYFIDEWNRKFKYLLIVSVTQGEMEPKIKLLAPSGNFPRVNLC